MKDVDFKFSEMSDCHCVASNIGLAFSLMVTETLKFAGYGEDFGRLSRALFQSIGVFQLLLVSRLFSTQKIKFDRIGFSIQFSYNDTIFFNMIFAHYRSKFERAVHFHQQL